MSFQSFFPRFLLPVFGCPVLDSWLSSLLSAIPLVSPQLGIWSLGFLPLFGSSSSLSGCNPSRQAHFGARGGVSGIPQNHSPPTH